MEAAVRSGLRSFFRCGDGHEGAFLLVHLNIVIYAVSFWLCQPILPFLTKQLGADEVAYGWLQSWFSLIQLIGGPWMGRLTDTQGPRYALVTTQLASALSYGLLAAAQSQTVLFLSKAPAVVQHCMQVAQAFVSAYTDRDGRTEAIGRLSLSYGIGMIVGSSAGGFLSKVFGNQGVALLASLLSVGVAMADVVLLPNVHTEKEKESGEGEKKGGESGWSAFVGLILQEGVGVVLVFKILLGMAFRMYESTFSLALAQQFELDAAAIGLVLTFGAALSVATNTFLVGTISRSLGEVPSVTLATASASVCFFFYSFVSSVSGLFIVLLPKAVSSTLVYTVTTSLLASLADPSQRGLAIGVSHATRSLCGLVAPPLGGWLMKTQGVRGLALCCCGVAGVACLFLVVCRRLGLIEASSVKKEEGEGGGDGEVETEKSEGKKGKAKKGPDSKKKAGKVHSS